jgi:hypothetical protein
MFENGFLFVSFQGYPNPSHMYNNQPGAQAQRGPHDVQGGPHVTGGPHDVQGGPHVTGGSHGTPGGPHGRNPTYGGHVPPATHQPQAMSKPITRQPNTSWIPNPADFQHRQQNRPPHPTNPVSSATSVGGGTSNLMSVINSTAHLSSAAAAGVGHWNSMVAGSNPSSIMSSMVNHSVRNIFNSLFKCLGKICFC